MKIQGKIISAQKKINKAANSAFKRAFLGSISIDDLAKSSKREHHVYDSFTEKVTTPEAITMNFIREAQSLQSSTFTTPNIFTSSLHNVCFSPRYNILYTQSRQIIRESISTQRELTQFDIRTFYQKPVDQIAGVCATFRSHKNCYYHTLIDNLPRLYLLHHPRFQKMETVQLLCAGSPTVVEKFYLEQLLPENVKVLQIDQTRPYLLDNLIFPSFLSRRFSGYLPSEYRNWFVQLVGPKRPRNKHHRIFISRVPTSKGALRCIVNEEELYDTLRPYGFKRYVLEQLSIREQIELFYDAEAVVATHGAGLTNTLFSAGIKVLELFPIPFVVPHYYFLAKAMGHQYRYLCSDRTYLSSNFSVNISEISRILESYMD
ncbi:MAG: glycosyltransferase family 61 protein [Cyanobacteria bacterium J06560_6]